VNFFSHMVPSLYKKFVVFWLADALFTAAPWPIMFGHVVTTFDCFWGCVFSLPTDSLLRKWIPSIVRYLGSELWCIFFCKLHTRCLSSEEGNLGRSGGKGGWKSDKGSDKSKSLSKLYGSNKMTCMLLLIYFKSSV
jgi:hypothetical protein